MRVSLLGSLLVLAVAHRAATADTPPWTLSMNLNGSALEGTPLRWNDRDVLLLSRDGRLWEFPTKQAKEARKTSSTFRGYSAGEMKERLAKELGKGFDIKHTGHYLVATPKGSKQDWAPRFEEMYRQFVHYFTIRGLAPKEPEFPLVAIIWPTQQDFQRYAAAEGSPMANGFLGYYASKSNRVALYDQQTAGGDWSANADTIIHEVTHQTAFNTGVHRRFADTPRWLTEGLGTMFEAKGVWNSRSFPRREDRLNRGRLYEFMQRLPRRKTGLTAEMIAGDRLFQTDPSTAYAEAWAFSFYLAEKLPRKYCDYLALTSKKPTFADYPAAERVKDFVGLFGDLKLLEAQYLRFMDELK